MYIDTDTHYLPRTWLDRLDHPAAGKAVRIEWQDGNGIFWRDGRKDSSFPETEWNLEKRLPHMDEEGFDIQVLIPENRPLDYDVDPELGCALARAYNNAAAEEIQQHPRFLGVAWVFLPDVLEAAREVERAVKELGLRAVKVIGGFGKVNLGTEALNPFYARVEELGIPMLVHPTSRNHNNSDFNPVLVGADRFGAEYGFLGGGALGFPITYMLTITQLIFSGTLDRFPKLKFGFFEAGAGWLPYMVNRLDVYYVAEQRQGRAAKVEYPKRMPGEYFDQLYVAAMSKESYLPDTVKRLPNHRIIIGSDFPHNDPNSTWPNTLAELRAMVDLPAAERQRILETNPREFFGL